MPGADAAGTTQVCTAQNTAGTNVTLAPSQYTLWIYDFDAGTLSPVLGADGHDGGRTGGHAGAQPVPAFPAINPPTTAQQNMITADVGLLDISSVYDFDGNDTAVPSIPRSADPGQAAFYTRPPASSASRRRWRSPTRGAQDQPSAFGPAGMGMREILGYAPIQPDGSVQIQVPANVPFTIDVLDANARRISAQHTSWLQVIPGEIKQCNGCHMRATTDLARPRRPDRRGQHGRAHHRRAVPEHQPALFANAGETMAQTLARITCETGSPLEPGAYRSLLTFSRPM